MILLNKLARFFLLSLLIFVFSCEEENPDFADDRDAFLGSWSVTESCSKDSYTVQIVEDPSNSAQVLINNFWNTGNCGTSPYGIVAGNSIYLPKQYFCDGDFQVNGDGELNKENVSWSYSIDDGADLSTCDANYSKK